MKCVLSIFKTGTILIARMKSQTFQTVQDFTSVILIPILRNLIEEAGKGAVKEGSGDLGVE